MTWRRRIVGISLLVGVAAFPAPSIAAHPGVDEQIGRMNDLIAASPEDATLYVRRGELHRIHRDWTSAETDLLTALALEPELATAELCLARVKSDAGKPTDAKPYLDRYLKRRPNDVEALALRGRVLEAMGEHLKAAEDLTRCIENESRDPRPENYLDRARALQAAGPEHLARAIEGLDEGRARLGDPVTLQLFAVDLEIERRNYDGALRRIDELARGSVRQEPWLVRRGTILEAAGRPTDARAAYVRAIAAIETLPKARRDTKAVSVLESEARAALQRLDEQTPTQ